MLCKIRDESSIVPEISIITVVRNGREDIEKTILSVICQKNESIEYVVIDGASNDGTVALIEKYSEYIDFWISEPDFGIYDAMNKGIALANGKCIALLNCGDTYFSSTLHDVLTEMLKLNSRYFVIAGGISTVDKNGDVRKVLLVNTNSLKRKLSQMPLHHPAMFVSKTIYDDIGTYNTGLSISADYEFVLKILEKNIDISFIDRPLTKMLVGGVSDSIKTIFTLLKESYCIRRKYSGVLYCAIFSAKEALAVVKSRLFL
jgi:glycosyltransferase involved in cell wall biosynthesis